MANKFEQELKRREGDPFQAELMRRQQAKPDIQAPTTTLGKVARTADDVVRSIASGASYGTADEFSAKMNELIGLGDYETNLEYERARDREISPWIRIPGEAAGMMATLPLAPQAGLAKMVGMGAAQGGAYGFGAGEGGAKERLKSAVIGGGLGAAGGAVGRALSGLISPAASRNPAVKELMQEGITPTPGQLAGPAARRVEEASASIMLLGSAIRGGERRAVKEFNQAVINRALKATGKTVKGAGHEAMDEAHTIMRQAWDDALTGIEVRMDEAFADELRAFIPQMMDDLDGASRKVLARKMQNIAELGAMKDPTMTGREAQKIISELGTLARKHLPKGGFEQTLGEAYEGIRQSFMKLMQRNASPAKALKIDQLRKSYPEWLVVQKAAAAGGAHEGIFSPAQYLHAVRSTDPSKLRLYSRGLAAGQKFGKAGQTVLGKTVPDSGTPERAMVAAVLGGGAGAMIDPMTGLAIGAGIGTAAMPYTPLLQKAIASGMTARPAQAQALAELAKRLGLGAGYGAASAYAGP